MAKPIQPSRREAQLGNLFVHLADTLVAEFDLDDVLHTLVKETAIMTGVNSAAIFLANTQGTLGVAAATTSMAHAIETLVLENEDSPCLEAHRTGVIISVDDVNHTPLRWAPFANTLSAAGLRSCHSVPLQIRGQALGVLTLLHTQPHTLNEADSAAAATIAHAASIALAQYRHTSGPAVLTDQLQHALGGRIMIEQAKGIVANSRHLSQGSAFTTIRNYARRQSEPIRSVCRRIINNELTLE
jgi:GAF domain-containing protein